MKPIPGGVGGGGGGGAKLPPPVGFFKTVRKR